MTAVINHIYLDLPPRPDTGTNNEHTNYVSPYYIYTSNFCQCTVWVDCLKTHHPKTFGK